MSAEFKMSGYTVSLIKGKVKKTRNIDAQNFDVAGTDYTSGVRSIAAGGTTGTAITVDSVLGTQGFAMFTNLDPTNFVELGLQVSGTFCPFMTILKGETSPPIRLAMATGALYARANTAAVELEVDINEA